MSTSYVNKSGSDNNGGTSPADAWLTIQHAVDTAASGDTIIVQSGVYEENIMVNTSFLTIEGDGYVVLDGKSIGGNAISRDGGSYLTLNNLIIRNYDFAVTYNRSIYLNYVYVTRCNRISLATWWDKYAELSHVLVGPNVTYYFETRRGHYNIDHSSILGDWILETNYARDIVIKNSYFAKDINLGDNSNIITLDYNNIRGSIHYKGTTYPTLSDFQNAYPNLAPHSINENGDFNNDYTLRWSSPNIGAGEAGVDIGARGPASYFESTDEIFEGANLTNVSRNANGDFELDGGATTGTVVSAVLDFGKDITLGNLRMESNEGYPSDVIDSDVSDSAPNRANYEYRSATDADGSFLQGDATPAWQTIERGVDLNLTCRYFQVRITLRSNGVAA